MRKTLLIAAAALAASVISSEAQVYSQNIVGYANVPTPANGGYYLVSIPFKIGVSNGANEIFSVGNNGVTATLPDYSQILIWNINTLSYTAYLSDSTSPTLFDDSGFSPISAPTLPVGMGFFLIPSAANVTNTFAGTVAINVGTSTTNTLANNGGYYLVGSTVPYAGTVTNGNFTGVGVNLTGFPDYTQVLIWKTASLSYDAYLTDSTSPTLYDDAGFSPTAAPSITVGQGFFIIPSAANAKWIQSL